MFDTFPNCGGLSPRMQTRATHLRVRRRKVPTVDNTNRESGFLLRLELRINSHTISGTHDVASAFSREVFADATTG